MDVRFMTRLKDIVKSLAMDLFQPISCGTVNGCACMYVYFKYCGFTTDLNVRLES